MYYNGNICAVLETGVTQNGENGQKKIHFKRSFLFRLKFILCIVYFEKINEWEDLYQRKLGLYTLKFSFMGRNDFQHKALIVIGYKIFYILNYTPFASHKG